MKAANRVLPLAICLITLSNLSGGKDASPPLTTCISEQMRSYDLSTLDQTSLLRVMMSIQHNDFSYYQHNATLNAKYKAVFEGSATYSDFTQKRETYSQENS